MAWTFNVNTVPTTGAAAIFALKTLMKAAGWTVPRSSDGTTYNAAGDQITLATSGAGGMANNSAWFVLQHPSHTRQYVFQRGTNNTVWRAKYSPAAGFTGGTPTITKVPLATDEVVLFGSGTDILPTYATLFSTDATYRMHCMAGGLAEGYSFVLLTHPTGSVALLGCTIYGDAMQTGSYPSADLDPWVAGVFASSTGFASVRDAAANTSARAYLGALATANAMIVEIPSISNHFPGGVGPSAWSSKDSGVPCFWGRRSSQPAPAGLKGASTLLQNPSTARTNMDTIDTVTTRDRIYLSGYWLPWDGSIPVI